MKIATGEPEDHPTPLPLNSAASPGVVAPTVREPGSTGPADAGLQLGGVRDTTGERLSQLATAEAAIGAAQSAGQVADADRRGRYEASMAPLGASYGDAMDLPPVPSASLPPAMSNLFPFGGDEPVTAAAGFEDPEYGT